MNIFYLFKFGILRSFFSYISYHSPKMNKHVARFLDVMGFLKIVHWIVSNSGSFMNIRSL